MGTVDTVLADHVTLRVQSVDRIGVAGYIPSLMYEGGLVRFLLHRAQMLGPGAAGAVAGAARSAP